MIIDVIDGITTIRPSEGYKYITNGAAWSACVYLGKSASADAWTDTNTEPPPDPEPDEEATAEDYEAALGRFGV